MTYSYRAEVTMIVDLVVEASSYTMAEEQIGMYLAPVSDEKRVDVFGNDGISVDNISSDDDPADDDE